METQSDEGLTLETSPLFTVANLSIIIADKTKLYFTLVPGC